jgi:hypothetical protein
LSMPAVLHSSHAGAIRSCGAVLVSVGLAVLTGDANAAAESVRFELAAQPIASAIEAYSARTGLEVYYDGALAKGRRSNAVLGLFATDAALRELLVGTGLTARVTSRGGFTLVPAPPPRIANAADQPYFAMIQAKISQALCGSAQTRPGSADLLIRVWIASSGTIQRTQLIDASDAAMESAFAALLRGLLVGAPPADLPQPVTMAVLARRPGQPTGCANPLAGSR